MPVEKKVVGEVGRIISEVRGKLKRIEKNLPAYYPCRSIEDSEKIKRHFKREYDIQGSPIQDSEREYLLIFYRKGEI